MRKIYSKFKLFFLLLIVSITNNCSSDPVEIHINQIEAVVDNCTLPYIVSFYSTLDAQSNKVNFHWDFGDGQTSDEKNPKHVYENTNVYTVTLKIDGDGNDKQSLVLDLQQDTLEVVSKFSYEAKFDNFHAPAEIKFINESAHGTKYFWEFSDNTSSINFDAIKRFEKAGNYKATLKAICAGDTAIHTKTVKILPPPRKITVEAITVNLPPAYENAELRCEVHYSIYKEIVTPIFKVAQYPVTWETHEELFFSGFTFNETISFDVIDMVNQVPVYGFSISTNQLQIDLYPSSVFWDNGQGKSAEVHFSYR